MTRGGRRRNVRGSGAPRATSSESDERRATEGEPAAKQRRATSDERRANGRETSYEQRTTQRRTGRYPMQWLCAKTAHEPSTSLARARRLSTTSMDCTCPRSAPCSLHHPWHYRVRDRYEHWRSTCSSLYAMTPWPMVAQRARRRQSTVQRSPRAMPVRHPRRQRREWNVYRRAATLYKSGE